MRYISLSALFSRRLRSRALIAGLLVSCSPAFGDDWITYDACLGTLPDQQGWSMVDHVGITSPSNCLLHVGPTLGGCPPDGGYRYWYKDFGPECPECPEIKFEEFVTVEWKLIVHNSNYINEEECVGSDACGDAGGYRVGCEVAVFDRTTKHFFIGYVRETDPLVSGLYLDTEGQYCPSNTEFKTWAELAAR